jgi:hypothetical protein
VPGCGRADAGFSSLTTRTAADGLEKCNSAFKVYIRAPLGPVGPEKSTSCPRMPLRAVWGSKTPRSRSKWALRAREGFARALFQLDSLSDPKCIFRARRGSKGFECKFSSQKGPSRARRGRLGPEKRFRSRRVPLERERARRPPLGPENVFWSPKGPEGVLSGPQDFFSGPKGSSRALRAPSRARRGSLGPEGRQLRAPSRWPGGPSQDLDVFCVLPRCDVSSLWERRGTKPELGWQAVICSLFCPRRRPRNLPCTANDKGLSSIAASSDQALYRSPFCSRYQRE